MLLDDNALMILNRMQKDAQSIHVGNNSKEMKSIEKISEIIRNLIAMDRYKKVKGLEK